MQSHHVTSTILLRTLLVALSVVILSTGCMSMRKEQDHYLIPDIDIDQTLKVAEDEKVAEKPEDS